MNSKLIALASAATIAVTAVAIPQTKPKLAGVVVVAGGFRVPLGDLLFGAAIASRPYYYGPGYYSYAYSPGPYYRPYAYGYGGGPDYGGGPYYYGSPRYYDTTLQTLDRVLIV